MDMTRRVGVLCPQDSEEHILDALYGDEVVFLESAGPLEAARAARDAGYTHLLVFDGAEGVDDSEYIDCARELKGNCEVVFFTTTLSRKVPDAFFTRLVDAGCVRIAVADGQGSWVKTLVAAINRPNPEEASKKYCASAKAIPAKEVRKEGASLRAASKPAIQEEIPGRYVSVAQGVPREGSTHLSLALARTIRLTGAKVACVLPAYHVRQLQSAYRNAPVDPHTGVLRISHVDIYEGESPRCVPPRYDVVICDFGVMDWLSAGRDPEETTRKEIRRQAYYTCEVRVLASQLAPTGPWLARDHVMPLMLKRDLGSVVHAVFGVPSEDYARALKISLNEKFGLSKDNLVAIGYIPSPLSINDLDEADPGIKEIAARVLGQNKARIEKLYGKGKRAHEQDRGRERQYRIFEAMAEAGELDLEAYKAAAHMSDVQIDEAVEQIRTRAQLKSERERFEMGHLRELVCDHEGDATLDFGDPKHARQLEVARAMIDKNVWWPMALSAAKDMDDQTCKTVCASIAAGAKSFADALANSKQTESKGLLGRLFKKG